MLPRGENARISSPTRNAWLERTGSPFLAGVTFTLAFLPYLFGGALLSSLVDRVPPRSLMIGCDLLSALVVALMAVSAVPVPALLALLFLLGLISPVASGMRNTLLTVVLPPASFIAGRSLFRIPIRVEGDAIVAECPGPLPDD